MLEGLDLELLLQAGGPAGDLQRGTARVLDRAVDEGPLAGRLALPAGEGMALGLFEVAVENRLIRSAQTETIST